MESTEEFYNRLRVSIVASVYTKTMHKSIRYATLLLSALLLSGCFWELSDFHAPLTGGYSLWRTSAYRISVTPDGGWSSGDPIKDNAESCHGFQEDDHRQFLDIHFSNGGNDELATSD